MTKELSWREAIKKVLSDAPGALHYHDVAARVISEGLRKNVGATPSMTASSRLSTAVTNEGSDCPFRKVGRGLYEWKRDGNSPPQATCEGPEFLRFFRPTIEALIDLDGKGTTSEITDKAFKILGISKHEQSIELKSGGSRVKNQAQWARHYLMRGGLIVSPERSIFELTELGRQLDLNTYDFLAYMNKVIKDYHEGKKLDKPEFTKNAYRVSKQREMVQSDPTFTIKDYLKEFDMTRTITRPAAIVKQGNLQLYTTSLRVADILMDNFYDIERLDPDNPDDKGYQRVLNKGRAKKLADYLIAGQDNHDAFLPTSIFLATDKDIAFDAESNSITFDIDKIGPFSVVDGQHRIEGLKLAAEKKPAILSFEVPVNIGINLPKVAQMCHFLIVNTTQKSVDKAVEQRIFARLSEVIGYEDVPNLPKWIQRIVESGDDEVALKIADYLNDTAESIWYGKIEMANQDIKSAQINQKSFVKFIKKYVLTANNPITLKTLEQQQKIMLNYWNAIANILYINKPTVLFKYVGVELFCRFSLPIFNKLINIGNFKVATIEKVIRETFDNLDGEYIGLGHPEWWLSSTGVAGGLNSTASGKLLQELTKALHKSNASIEIEL